MSVPEIGAKVADKILELREAKGDLELDDPLSNVPISFPLSLTWPCPVPSHFPINLSTLLTLSLCRSYRDPRSIEELMSVPGIGAKVADKILELREAKGDLELDDLNQVPYLRITQPLLDCLDFTSFLLLMGLYQMYPYPSPFL
jgi:DNA polymerase/3'-5' exonuclease PolX